MRPTGWTLLYIIYRLNSVQLLFALGGCWIKLKGLLEVMHQRTQKTFSRFTLFHTRKILTQFHKASIRNPFSLLNRITNSIALLRNFPKIIGDYSHEIFFYILFILSEQHIIFQPPVFLLPGPLLLQHVVVVQQSLALWHCTTFL